MNQPLSDETEGKPLDYQGASLTVSRRPTRAEKRAANRAKQDAARLQAQALADVPAPFRPGNLAAPESTSVGSVLPSAEERRTAAREAREQADARGEGEKRGRGRPEEYTDEEADLICQWITEGGSLRSYCRQTGRAVITVYRWMRERADFCTRYGRAHEDRADTLADEMIEIADEAAKNASIEGVAAAKLRVDTRKWIASKMRPERYGDKVQVERTGSVSIRIGIDKPQPQALPMAEVVESPAVTPRLDRLHIGRGQ